MMKNVKTTVNNYHIDYILKPYTMIYINSLQNYLWKWLNIWNMNGWAWVHELCISSWYIHDDFQVSDTFTLVTICLMYIGDRILTLVWGWRGIWVVSDPLSGYSNPLTSWSECLFSAVQGRRIHHQLSYSFLIRIFDEYLKELALIF